MQSIIDYEIENSCDEKLLNLMANRVGNESKLRQVQAAIEMVTLGGTQ